MTQTRAGTFRRLEATDLLEIAPLTRCLPVGSVIFFRSVKALDMLNHSTLAVPREFALTRRAEIGDTRLSIYPPLLAGYNVSREPRYRQAVYLALGPSAASVGPSAGAFRART